MSTAEATDFINTMSVFTFKDGSRKPGIIINKYNLQRAAIEYYFIEHHSVNPYRQSALKGDQEKCNELCRNIALDQIHRIEQMTYSDYKEALRTQNIC
jgi:hypothetical protein